MASSNELLVAFLVAERQITMHAICYDWPLSAPSSFRPTIVDSVPVVEALFCLFGRLVLVCR